MKNSQSKAMKTLLFLGLFFLLICAAAFAGNDEYQEGKKLAYNDSPQVELYITNWCPYCKKAVKFFQSRGIPYKAYDIEKDSRAAKRKKKLDPSPGVPFALINGHKIHGYSEQAYLRALGKR